MLRWSGGESAIGRLGGCTPKQREDSPIESSSDNILGLVEPALVGQCSERVHGVATARVLRKMEGSAAGSAKSAREHQEKTDKLLLHTTDAQAEIALLVEAADSELELVDLHGLKIEDHMLRVSMPSVSLRTLAQVRLTRSHRDVGRHVEPAVLGTRKSRSRRRKEGESALKFR